MPNVKKVSYSPNLLRVRLEPVLSGMDAKVDVFFTAAILLVLVSSTLFKNIFSYSDGLKFDLSLVVFLLTHPISHDFLKYSSSQLFEEASVAIFFTT